MSPGSEEWGLLRLKSRTPQSALRSNAIRLLLFYFILVNFGVQVMRAYGRAYSETLGDGPGHIRCSLRTSEPLLPASYKTWMHLVLSVKT